MIEFYLPIICHSRACEKLIRAGLSKLQPHISNINIMALFMVRLRINTNMSHGRYKINSFANINGFESNNDSCMELIGSVANLSEIAL